ncbi:MAG TPA: ABC transporter substrate-binding protein [Gemmatimonadaceae bacterium]|nr:ABC transporter substrate-binding protein [Gemmatimonadaceae bacterium]
MGPETDRRQFLMLAAGGVLAALRPPLPTPARRIGILAPPPALRDAAIRDALQGLQLGREEAARTALLFGREVAFVEADAEPGDMTSAANRLVDQGADALIAALPASASRQVAAVAAAAKRVCVHLVAPAPDAARDAHQPSWNFYLAPSTAARADAVLRALHESPAMRRLPRVLLAAGTDAVAAATRADATVAAALSASPLLTSAPGDVESRGAAALVVFAAYDAADARRLLDQAGGRSFPGLVADLFGSTEQLERSVLPARLVRADAWSPDLVRFGAAQLNDRFRARFGAGAEMRGPAWAGWFAAKIVVEATLRARAQDAAALAEVLRVARFDGHQGKPLAFAPGGELLPPLHIAGSLESGGS